MARGVGECDCWTTLHHDWACSCPQALAQRAQSFSGHRALFCAVLSKPNQTEKVAWIKNDDQKSVEDYLRSAQAAAKEQNKPLVTRQGGKHDLGILGGSVDEVNKVGHFVLHDAPRSWDQHDVLQLLNQAEWRQVEILTRKRSAHKASPPMWLFKALKPEAFASQDSWTYADDIEDIFLTVTTEQGPQRKQAQAQTSRLQAPKKQWVDRVSYSKPPPDANPTQMDDSSDEEAQVVKSTPAPKARPARARSRSRERKRNDRIPVEEHPDQLLLKQLEGPWIIVDKGGTGDCVYRSAAAAIGITQHKVFKEDALVNEASKLRLLVAAYLRSHKSEFTDRWVADSADTEGWANHAPPEDYDAYLSLITMREVWADNYQIMALAARVGIPIVVWTWSAKDRSWCRSVHAPWFRNGVARPPANDNLSA